MQVQKLSDKYLELLERRLDDQQKKVCCTEKNAVVAAGAGSGKTEVLANRFAYLVMSCGVHVDEILTLTFTNKAASEMYERIYSRLSFFASHKDVEPKARGRAEDALRHFSDAHIQTLDSYCAAIVRRAANRYGVRPDFSVDKAAADREAKFRALPFALRYRDDEAVLAISDAGMLQDVANNFFAKTISEYTSLATANDFFRAALPRQRKEIAYAWNKFVCGSYDCAADEVQSVSLLIEKIREIYPSLKQEKRDGEYCRLLFQALPYDENDSSGVVPDFFYIDIDGEKIKDGSIVEQVSNFSAWLSKFCFKQNMSGYTKELRTIVNGELIKKTIPFVESISSYIINYKHIVRLAELLDLFLAEVNESKRQIGCLSFFDVTELALKILCEQPDVLDDERISYKKIMIDEFQDNNGKNRDLLFLISSLPDATAAFLHENNPAQFLESEKLFFVGDEKQSIYKFRGADVAVFNRLKKDLGDDSVLGMVYNYRSTPQMLAAFNQFFGAYKNVDGEMQKIVGDEFEDGTLSNCVFPEVARQEFVATFDKKTIAKKFDIAKREVALPATLSSENVPLHICMYDTSATTDDEYLDDTDQIAFFVAQKIKNIVESGGKGYCPDGEKISYKDIAILDRSRTHRGNITRALSVLGISYNVDQHKNLFDEALANDIYYFLRLCIYPSDINAYAVFLRSPFVALSEQGAETVLAIAISAREKKQRETDTLVAFVPFDKDIEHEIQQNISKDEYEKYTVAAARHLEMSQFALSHKITDTLSKLWYDYGYRYEFMWSTTAALFGEQFDLLFEVARMADADSHSVAWFIDELAAKKSFALDDDSDIETEDVSFPTEERDAVHIMTIHKSKGLEFPIVFVLGCDGMQKTDRDGRYVFMDENDGISIKINKGVPNYFFQKQKDEANAKSFAEFQRLVYVAVTRAEHHAFIVGKWSGFEKAKSKSDSSNKNIIKNILLNYYNETNCDAETVFADGAPFDFTSIVPQKKEELYKFTKRNLSGRSSPIDKMYVIEKAISFYEKADVVDTPKIMRKAFSPSSLEFYDDESHSVDGADFCIRGDSALDDAGSSTVGVADAGAHGAVTATSGAKNLYAEIDSAITSKFTPRKFGILAHAYLEAAVQGRLSSFFAPEFITQDIDDANRDTVKNTCVCMAEKFLSSDIGKKICECRDSGGWYKTEYKFKNAIEDYIVTGTIDLIFKTEDGAIIVDYKTDKEIVPERYIEQLYCYRNAAESLCGVSSEKIKCFLYYLRYDKLFDVTQKVALVTSTDIIKMLNTPLEITDV